MARRNRRVPEDSPVSETLDEVGDGIVEVDLAKRTETAAHEPEIQLDRGSPAEPAEPTVADQVAEYIGKAFGDLMNRKDALTKELAGVDEQLAGLSKRVQSQLGQYLPAGLPSLGAFKRRGRPPGSGKTAKAAKAGKAGSKKQRRGMSEETKAKMRASQQARWAAKKAQG